MKDVKTALYYGSIIYVALLSAWFLTRRGGRQSRSAGRIALLVLWIAAAAYVTVLSRLGGALVFPSDEAMRSYAENRINLNPMLTVRNMIRGLRAGTYPPRAAAMNVIGNLILFCPAAGFVRSFTRRGRVALSFLASCAGSLTVEGAQLILMAGSFDVDDLILNAAGATIFAVILAVRHRGAGGGSGGKRKNRR